MHDRPVPDQRRPAPTAGAGTRAVGALPRNATWLTRGQLDRAAAARRRIAALPAGLPLVQPLVRAQLAAMFGVPDLVGRGDPAAPVALFGPGSPSRTILGEPASIAGGIRSLFVQAAHPLAMAGVSDHSRFRTAPLERLEGTSAWVTITAFGTVEAVAAEVRRIRAMHRRVVGVHEGEPYAASDPRLLVWVSVALTSSFLAAHQLLSPITLPRRELDRFVAEQGLAAALLDPRLDLDALPPHAWPALDVAGTPLGRDGLPTDLDGLRDVLASFHGELGVTPAAREAMSFLWTVGVPPAVQPVYGRVLDGVAATLPAGLREALDLRIDADARLGTLVRLMSTMRVATGRSPSAARADALLGEDGGAPVSD
ncbi:MAG: oxygenase MpaB family protein [Actinomycetes bacterium]